MVETKALKAGMMFRMNGGDSIDGKRLIESDSGLRVSGRDKKFFLFGLVGS
jgi:hypothetical protein